MSINGDKTDKLFETPDISKSLASKPTTYSFSAKVSDAEVHSSSNDRSAEKSFEILDLVTEFTEKISLSQSPKSLNPSINPNSSLENSIKPKDLENLSNKVSQLAEDLKYIWFTFSISKMIGSFKLLLDKRLKKVVYVKGVKTEGKATKIALEVVPLFEKYSNECSNGDVQLGLSENRAWVRGLYYRRGIEIDTLEEIKNQALAQGIYLRTLRVGYMKAVYI